MMLGYLLARAGVDTVVLEKHSDFFRDFRGDTVHPSTLEILVELGLDEEFLQLPHNEMREGRMSLDGKIYKLVEMASLPTKHKFVCMVPQWDFLSFLQRKSQPLPAYRLIMDAEVTDLIRTGDRVAGVRFGDTEVRATLTVAADGRHSDVRELAGMKVVCEDVPIDVLWMRIPKDAAPHEGALGYIVHGQMVVLLDRGDYFQCGVVIAKGALEAFKMAGIEAFRANLLKVAPFLSAGVETLTDWDSIKLLTVRIDHLERWCQDGLLCIGDAAHAMSPVGGVGVNLAIQDAVATANLLTEHLRKGTAPPEALAGVQARREPPTFQIQRMQRTMHEWLLSPKAANRRWIVKAIIWIASTLGPLRRLAGRTTAMGPLPEHIASLP